MLWLPMNTMLPPLEYYFHCMLTKKSKWQTISANWRCNAVYHYWQIIQLDDEESFDRSYDWIYYSWVNSKTASKTSWDLFQRVKEWLHSVGKAPHRQKWEAVPLKASIISLLILTCCFWDMACYFLLGSFETHITVWCWCVIPLCYQVLSKYAAEPVQHG